MDTLTTKRINLRLSLDMQGQSDRPIETRSVYQPTERWSIYRRKIDTRNDEEEVDRKGKQIMKAPPQSCPKFKVPGVVKIIELQYSPERSPPSPPFEPCPKRQITDHSLEDLKDEIIVTDQDMQVGMPSPPRSSKLVLSNLDMKGKSV